MNFTGLPEVDLNILLKLDLPDLLSTCRSSLYLSSLCSDDYLWLQKSREDYPQFLHLKKYFSTWREFYINVTTNAIYYLDGPISYASNNIECAYRKLIETLNERVPDFEFPPIEHSGELEMILQGMNLGLGDVGLYLVFIDRSVGYTDPDALLFSLIEKKIKPRLQDYPQLRTKGTFIPRLDDENFIVERLTSQGIFGRRTIIMPINREPIVLDQVTRGIYVKKTMPLVVVSKFTWDYMIAPIPDQYYSQLEFEGNERELWATLDSIKELLPQIYDRLEWEPLENLVNYN